MSFLLYKPQSAYLTTFWAGLSLHLLHTLLNSVPMPPILALVPPDATPHTTPMPPLMASAKPFPCQIAPTPPPPPLLHPPYRVCANLLAPPGPPSVTPHTALPSQHPLWSAGTGSGAASLAPALLGPHPRPAASTSFRSLPGLHCRGMCTKTHQVVLGAFYMQAVVTMAYTMAYTTINASLLDEARASWCCMLHLKASWGRTRTHGDASEQTAVWNTSLPSLHVAHHEEKALPDFL